MRTELTERRQYKRIFFSIKDGPTAVFKFPGNYREPITAIVMDLSVGGLGLSLKKDKNLIDVGNRMLLSEIKGIKSLASVRGMEVEIKWIRSYESFEHTLFGCEFLNISDAGKASIQQFIDGWAMRF